MSNVCVETEVVAKQERLCGGGLNAWHDPSHRTRAGTSKAKVGLLRALLYGTAAQDCSHFAAGAVY